MISLNKSYSLPVKAVLVCLTLIVIQLTVPSTEVCSFSVASNEINLNSSTAIDKLRRRNDKVDASLNLFMKKFHYIYLHSKIFETPIEKLNEILEQLFLHKIDKYYYYQDQIKQFQLMKDDDAEQDNNEHDEEIQEYLKSLKNERKAYYIVLENLIKSTCDKIKNICEEAQIQDDKNVKKYLDELMNSIAKIFI